MQVGLLGYRMRPRNIARFIGQSHLMAPGGHRVARRGSESLGVPLHLRNARTELMKKLGHGKDYRYAHDELGPWLRGENYFPPEPATQSLYFSIERGMEIKIREKLAWLRDNNHAFSDADSAQ
jgi:replication-associated recombination protein RarA